MTKFKPKQADLNAIRAFARDKMQVKRFRIEACLSYDSTTNRESVNLNLLAFHEAIDFVKWEEIKRGIESEDGSAKLDLAVTAIGFYGYTDLIGHITAVFENKQLVSLYA